MYITYQYLSFFLFFGAFIFNSHADTRLKKQELNLATEQVLNIGLKQYPQTLDPQHILNASTTRIMFDLYEGLMTESTTGDIVPGVAENYVISDDLKTYTFFLRKNAKFSDGTPIEASDIVYTYQRLVNPQNASPSAFLLKPILHANQIIKKQKMPAKLGVKAVDPHTVEILLKAPTPHFLHILALPQLGILKKAHKQFQHNKDNIISSGPYSVVNWQKNEQLLTAHKNLFYWNSDNTFIEDVNYIPTTDTNTEIQMYQANQIDFTQDIPSSKVARLKKNIPDELKITPILATYYYEYNLTQPPFKHNSKLREALSLAINRNYLVKNTLGRGEVPAYDILPQNVFNTQNFHNNLTQLPFEDQLLKARNLYREAGYSAENPLNVTISYDNTKTHKQIAMAIVNMWEKAFGIETLQITTKSYTPKEFVKIKNLGQFQIARQGVIARYNHISSFLEFIEKYNTNQTAFIPLFHYATAHLVKPYVGGYTQENPLDHIYTRMLYIIEHSSDEDQFL